MIATAKSLGMNILDRIGNTPLVRLDRLTDHLPGIQIVGKAEWVNPGGSVKDRAASSIVVDAMKRGLAGEWAEAAGRDERQYGDCVCDAGRGDAVSGDAVHAVECV